MIDINQIPSPCYVLEEELLRRNLTLIKGVKDAAGVDIILAFKALNYKHIYLNILILSVVFSLFSCVNNKPKEEFKLCLKLDKNISKISDYTPEKGQFKAFVKFKNIGSNFFKTRNYIEFGKKGSSAFYFEAFDMNNNEINLSKLGSLGPDWFPDKLRELTIGEEINDTIDSGTIYVYNRKGKFKMRMAFNPNMYFYHEGQIAKQIIYSNWDTITIK